MADVLAPVEALGALLEIEAAALGKANRMPGLHQRARERDPGRAAPDHADIEAFSGDRIAVRRKVDQHPPASGCGVLAMPPDRFCSHQIPNMAMA